MGSISFTEVFRLSNMYQLCMCIHINNVKWCTNTDIKTTYPFLWINLVVEFYIKTHHEHVSVWQVYLVTDDGLVVSNPVAFIVHVQHPETSNSSPMGPAVFAGVLVLIVVLLAFTIALVTRAKRRHRQGKPLFKVLLKSLESRIWICFTSD